MGPKLHPPQSLAQHLPAEATVVETCKTRQRAPYNSEELNELHSVDKTLAVHVWGCMAVKPQRISKHCFAKGCGTHQHATPILLGRG